MTKTEIINKLKDLEKETQITILYACESGSRAWGFPSPDSDYDVRFINKHDLNWYLSIKNKKDVIAKPMDGLLDLGGWDLKKTLTLISRSNAVVWEWLQSPIVYFEKDKFSNDLWQLASQFYSLKACCYHYLSITKNTLNINFNSDKIKIKKYFYILRPLLAAKWICELKNIPPMNFFDLMDGLALKEEIKEQIKILLDIKEKTNEQDMISRMPIIDHFILKEFEQCYQIVEQLETGKKSKDVLDSFFQNLVLGK